MNSCVHNRVNVDIHHLHNGLYNVEKMLWVWCFLEKLIVLNHLVPRTDTNFNIISLIILSRYNQKVSVTGAARENATIPLLTLTLNVIVCHRVYIALLKLSHCACSLSVRQNQGI